ncbi:MAG: hypothetical protein VW378_07980 [bacterium]
MDNIKNTKLKKKLNDIYQDKYVKKTLKYAYPCLKFIEKHQKAVFISTITLLMGQQLYLNLWPKFTTFQTLKKEQVHSQPHQTQTNTLTTSTKIMALKKETNILRAQYFTPDTILEFATKWLPKIIEKEEIIIRSISYKSPKKVPPYLIHEINIDFNSSYTQWLNFLQGIENFEKKIHIINTSLTRNNSKEKNPILSSKITLQSIGLLQ